MREAEETEKEESKEFKNAWRKKKRGMEWGLSTEQHKPTKKEIRIKT